MQDPETSPAQGSAVTSPRNGPFRDHAHDDHPDDADHRNEPQQQRQGANIRALEKISHLHGGNGRHVVVVEIGDELADDQEQKNETAQAGERFRNGVDGVHAARDGVCTDAICHARHQEHQHDQHDQAVHER
jgi:hypothetical protein